MSERDMERLLALVERHLGRDWVDIGDWLRGLPANQVEAIERRLVQGDIAGLVAEVESAARTFAAATHRAHTLAGQEGAKWLDEQPQLAGRLVRYDAANPRAVIAAQRNELELVRGLTRETRETVQRAVIDGQLAGRNPREIAREVRDSITLTPTQSQHVANYRRALEQGDFANALGRELRDARSDATLRRLTRDGGALREEQIDRMVDRYRQNYVSYRAETIARTESARNVHAGLQETYRQAVERGDVEADSLVREWIPGPYTQHARPDHRSRALLGQRPGIGEPFVMDDGTRIMHPGDGPAEHTANCRCTVATTLR